MIAFNFHFAVLVSPPVVFGAWHPGLSTVRPLKSAVSADQGKLLAQVSFPSTCSAERIQSMSCWISSLASVV